MLKFQSLTNVRPTKDLGSQVILAPTPGQFKVTPDAAEAIGVTAGDYMQILKDTESGVVYVVKGSEDGLGSKLASANKAGGGTLTLSAAAAWEDMDGSSDHNIHYDVDVEAGVEQDEKTYFPLVFDRKEEKQVRKSKEAKEEVAEETAEISDEANDTEFADI